MRMHDGSLPPSPEEEHAAMQSYTQLYPQIYDFANLHHAYLKARRQKRYRPEVLAFSAQLEEQLIDIQNALIWKTYQMGPYHTFLVHEPKQRVIMALPFRDRVVQHALCNVIEPIFEARFLHDSYACRPGKGVHRGVTRLTAFLRRAHQRWGHIYALKADIAQYFPSIDHAVLLQLLGKHIRCADTLWLIAHILQSGGVEGKGLPIGNLTSQLWANVYLHALDMFVKHDLRMPFYLRYMDDFILLHPDKRVLHRITDDIAAFLDARLRLRLNAKTQIFPAAQGIDFLGYRVWRTHRRLRTRAVVRFQRRLRRLQILYARRCLPLARIRASIQSWLGHARHAQTYGLLRRLLAAAPLRRS